MTDRTTAFNELRPVLFGLAYRMLGTRADAEDIVQETYLRWQAAKAEEIRSTKAFLTTIVARLSLDHLKSARVQRETYIGTWLPEPIVGPQPVEMAESLSIAFLHVLESLSPAERVAFLMREIFEADYSDVAAVLETSETNCRQLVTRARTHLRQRRPRFTVDREKHASVLRRFMAACAQGDPAALLSVLKQDVVLYSDGGGKASAAINPIRGADRVMRFFAGVAKKVDTGIAASFTDVGGEPGCVLTIGGQPYTVISISVDDDERITAMYFTLNPEKIQGAACVRSNDTL